MVTRRSFTRPLAQRLLARLRPGAFLVCMGLLSVGIPAGGLPGGSGLFGIALAHAQDYEAAGRHFAAGQERYAGRRFHTAALHFQAAYEITKDPVLLFNVAEAYQKAGEPTKAVSAYRAYLQEKPGSQDRADVERRIALLDAKKPVAADESVPGDRLEAEAIIAAGGPPPLSPRAEAQPAPTATPAPSVSTAPEPPPVTAVVPTEPPATRPPEAAAPVAPAPQVGLLDDRPAGRLRVAAWCSVAATIALLTTGAILGLAAQSRGDEIGRRLGFVDSSGQPREFDAGARTDFESLRDEGKLYNGLAIGFFSAAGAMAITSTVLFVVDWKRGRDRQLPHALQIAPSLAPGAAGLVAGGSF